MILFLFSPYLSLFIEISQYLGFSKRFLNFLSETLDGRKIVILLEVLLLLLGLALIYSTMINNKITLDRIS